MFDTEDQINNPAEKCDHNNSPVADQHGQKEQYIYDLHSLF